MGDVEKPAASPRPMLERLAGLARARHADGTLPESVRLALDRVSNGCVACLSYLPTAKMNIVTYQRFVEEIGRALGVVTALPGQVDGLAWVEDSINAWLETLAELQVVDSGRLRAANEVLEAAVEHGREEIADLKEKLASEQATESATHFLDEAKTQLRWTIAASALSFSALACAALWAGLYPCQAPEDKWSAISVYSTKALVFALLLGVALGASRVVFALLHNTVVNRQRHNALRAFDGLYASANDAHRSVIVEHAARLIFAPIPTGLTKIRAEDLSVAGSVADGVQRVVTTAKKA